jgi:Acetyltransferase (GNAT) domain
VAVNGPVGVTVRPGSAADHGAMASILAEHRPEDEPPEWPERPDHLDHVLATGRVAVAELDGEVVGFASTVERGGVAYLCDAFVTRRLLGTGVGGRLLDELLPDGEAGDRFTFASADPRALALYVRHGMAPRGVLVYLAGDQAAARRLPPIRCRQASGSDADDATIRELDAAASGRERPQDLAFLRSLPSVRALLTGGVVEDPGYAFVRVAPGANPMAMVGPAGSRTERGSEAALLAAARFAGTLAPTVRVAVPGSHPALPGLLDAGFRLQAHDTFMASRPGVFDPGRYVPMVDLG